MTYKTNNQYYSKTFIAISLTFMVLLGSQVLAKDIDPHLVKPSEKPDLLNFHEVHSYLLRGGRPSPKGLEILKDKGVKYIIDLTHDTKSVDAEKAIAQNLNMEFINLPMSDKAPSKSEVDTFLDIVEKAKKNHEKVYVHCAHGSDRTGCMVGIWRVTHDHYSYPKAYSEMRKYYFSPKFTQLSGTVKQYSKNQN